MAGSRGSGQQHGTVGAFLCLLTMLVLPVTADCRAGEAVPEIPFEKELLRIGFTGHTYPLLIGDLQYYLADKLRAEKCDFIVIAGDVVAGASSRHLGHDLTPRQMFEEQWDKFRLFRDRLGGSIFWVPGNHDVNNARRLGGDVAEVLRARAPAPAPYYARRIRNCLLVFLNTVDFTASKSKYQLDARQMKWLRGLLSAESRESVPFLFMHHKLWALDEIKGRQPVGDTEQFARHVRPLLAPFKTVYVMAGDAGTRAPSRREGNVHYYAMSNSKEHIGYYVIDVEFGTGKVEVRTEREKHPRKRAKKKRGGRGLLRTRETWVGVLLGAAAAAAVVLAFKGARRLLGGR